MKEEGFTGASKDMMIVRYKAVYERGARVDQAEFNAFRPRTARRPHNSSTFVSPSRDLQLIRHSPLIC